MRSAAGLEMRFVVRQSLGDNTVMESVYGIEACCLEKAGLSGKRPLNFLRQNK